MTHSYLVVVSDFCVWLITNLTFVWENDKRKVKLTTYIHITNLNGFWCPSHSMCMKCLPELNVVVVASHRLSPSWAIVLSIVTVSSLISMLSLLLLSVVVVDSVVALPMSASRRLESWTPPRLYRRYCECSLSKLLHRCLCVFCAA